MEGGVIHEISALSAQLCCKSKIALQKQSLLKVGLIILKNSSEVFSFRYNVIGNDHHVGLVDRGPAIQGDALEQLKRIKWSHRCCNGNTSQP